MIINTQNYIENFLQIKNKAAEIVPFVINPPQMKLYNVIKKQFEQKKPIRVIILKARQMGFSTLSEAIIFKNTATAYNVSSAIVAHKEDATTNLFEMSKRFYRHLPEPLKPALKASNAKELIFDSAESGLNSRIKCFTAGGEAIGRGDTINNLHISEYAFWSGDKKNTLNGLLQAVPSTPNTLVIIESTANGYDHFKELWDKAVAGDSDFVPVFCAWWELAEYRMPYEAEDLTEEEIKLITAYNLDKKQIAWRRWVIKNQCGGDISLFKQEYPANEQEAFISTGECFFDKEAVVKRMQEVKKPSKRGYFSYQKTFDTYGNVMLNNVQWVEDEKGYIKIWRTPEANISYSVGCDTAGEGNDYYTAEIINCKTLEQVAELSKQKMNEDLFAEQCVCLGKYYNEGLIAVETNFNAYITTLIAKLGYTKQYISENAINSQYTKTSDKIGFKTTVASRPAILSELKIIFNENNLVINSNECLGEMLTFILSASGRRYEAMQGKHDDRIMALAIAYACRHQATRPYGVFSF